jgi:hypothetical protein
MQIDGYDLSGFGVTGYAELAGAPSAFAHGLLMIVLGHIASVAMQGSKN